MLQSLNYFRYLNCPLNGTCTRPYCVFKHKQETVINQTLNNQSANQQVSNEEELIQQKIESNKKSDDLALTLEKVKSLINSCDTTIDPALLKQQLDDLLSKTINNETNNKTQEKQQIIKSPANKIKSNKKNLPKNVPDYNPTPIYELNRIKKDKINESNGSGIDDLIQENNFNDENQEVIEDEIIEEEEEEKEDDDDDEDEMNLNNKRILNDDNKKLLIKKPRSDLAALTIGETKKDDNDIKKVLQQKTESIIRKMNNPMSYIAATGVPSSYKIDKLSLQQQLMKRYEIVAAQKAKENSSSITSSSSSLPSSSSTQKKPTQGVNTPKLIIDNTNKVPLALRQKYLNFIYQESKLLFPNVDKACEKAAEQEKSIYDRAKTRNIYANLAAHLIKSLRQQNQKNTSEASVKTPVQTTTTATLTTTTTTKYNLTKSSDMSIKRVEINKNNLKLVNRIEQKTSQNNQLIKKPTNIQSSQTTKIAFSHEAILAGPKASKISYTINRKKVLTLKDLDLNKLYKMMKNYVLTESQLDANGYPNVFKKNLNDELLTYLPKPVSQQTSISKYSIQNHTITNAKYNSSLEIKLCKRCSKTFTIDKDYNYNAKDDCVHHWGKLRKVRVNKALEQKYSCCSQDSKSEGCQIGKHVYDGDDYEVDKPLSGYVQTQESQNEDLNIYALDCEMCYTTKGLELARVSVVDTKLNLIYETIVVPDCEILDYNTRWSGLTKNSFENCNIKLKNVQNDLLKMFSKDTILIGHSLESDLKALKMIHKTVVDTSVVFPHKTENFKRALRNLTLEYLQKLIQEDTNGHDSKEDACACMELMLWKIEQDLKK